MLKRIWAWVWGPSGPSDRDVLVKVLAQVIEQQAVRDAQAAANAAAQTTLLANWLDMFKPKTPTKGWVNDDRNMALREMAEEYSKTHVLDADGMSEVERVNQLTRLMDSGF